MIYSDYLELIFKYIKRLRLISNYTSYDYNVASKEFSVTVNYKKTRFITFCIRIYILSLLLSLLVGWKESSLLAAAAAIGFVSLRITYYGVYMMICEDGVLEEGVFLMNKKIKFEAFIPPKIGKEWVKQRNETFEKHILCFQMPVVVHSACPLNV